MILRTQIRRYLLAGLFLILAACTPAETGIPVTGETPIPNTPSDSSGLPPEAVLDAQQWLAAQHNVATAQVQIIDVEQAEWTDSCLGLGRLNESCLQVITPGWRVIFEINGQSYEVRTDETGSTIRLASSVGTPGVGVILENTHWKLVAFGPPGSDTPLIKGSIITLMLSNGEASGTGGCNTYGGVYQVNDGIISFDEITRTLRACENEFLTIQQDHYFLALESASRYELDGNTLRIWFEDGAGVLVFETPMPAEAMPTVETPGG